MEEIFLFDVDGTLTLPRQQAKQDMVEFIKSLAKEAHIGFVGGSDLSKITEQLGQELINLANYTFAENGCVVLKNGEQIHEESIALHIGEENIKSLINFALSYMANIDIPIKRGTFIEYRKGMLNFSPIGRNCSQSEREAFVKWDETNQIRQKMVGELREMFSYMGLQFSIGGQISIDVFPVGWDKTHCLSHLEAYKTVHFFGDKTDPGGNDHEIFESERTVGHKVSGPEDTMAQVREILEVIN